MSEIFALRPDLFYRVYIVSSVWLVCGTARKKKIYGRRDSTHR